MINWRWYTWKTYKIRPSIGNQFYKGELTPMQKLMLARRRIFGCNYGSNYSSGRNVFKKTGMTFASRREAYAGAHTLDSLNRFPYLYEVADLEWKAELFEAKKLRILMRGVKVGRKKGGGRVNLMSVFQTKGGESTTAGSGKPAA